MTAKKTTTSIRIEVSTLDAIKKIAEEDHRTVSASVEILVREEMRRRGLNGSKPVTRRYTLKQPRT